MLQLATLSIILSVFVIIQLWRWDVKNNPSRKHKKPTKSVYSYDEGYFQCEETDL